jgi:hypothetical protein
MKISVKDLKKLIAEAVDQTKTKPDFDVEVEEIDDAGDYADTLAKHVDWAKELDLKEAKLRDELAAVLDKKASLKRFR